jgi:hypothetical protein
MRSGRSDTDLQFKSILGAIKIPRINTIIYIDGAKKAHDGAFVFRRPVLAARASRCCGAPLRHVALGPVTYVLNVIRNCTYTVCDS